MYFIDKIIVSMLSPSEQFLWEATHCFVQAFHASKHLLKSFCENALSNSAIYLWASAFDWK